MSEHKPLNFPDDRSAFIKKACAAPDSCISAGGDEAKLQQIFDEHWREAQRIAFEEAAKWHDDQRRLRTWATSERTHSDSAIYFRAKAKGVRGE